MDRDYDLIITTLKRHITKTSYVDDEQICYLLIDYIHEARELLELCRELGNQTADLAQDPQLSSDKDFAYAFCGAAHAFFDIVPRLESKRGQICEIAKTLRTKDIKDMVKRTQEDFIKWRNAGNEDIVSILDSCKTSARAQEEPMPETIKLLEERWEDFDIRGTALLETYYIDEPLPPQRPYNRPFPPLPVFYLSSSPAYENWAPPCGK